MTDYRLPGGPRQAYFDALYKMNLEYKVMPGLVYLYLPFLRDRLGWSRETCLWFAFLNGMTQNPLTSLRLFRELPEPPRTPQALTVFSQWFGASWHSLQFDTDRRYAKKETAAAIKSYCKILHGYSDMADDPQGYFLDPDGGSWVDLWEFVTTNFRSFGRLSSWSYLEYVRIYGSGHEPDDLLFADPGSRSHRNGMLFLLDMDHLVDDKRTGNPKPVFQPGAFKKMCDWLKAQVDGCFTVKAWDHPSAGLFTFESQLCTFKNSFFGRRYPGVYADMAWDRLEWYKANVGEDANYELIREAYATLPDWLQRGSDGLTIKERAAIFPHTGVPYRAEHFLT